jgi:hypothetical protein
VNADLRETTGYNEESDSFIIRTEYDNSEVLASNLQARNDAPEFGRYKGNLVKVGSIHLGDITRLKNEGYNLLSPDPEEVKRALLHIQSNEKALLTVPGRPIGTKHHAWA